MDLSQSLADVRVLDPDGNSVRLGDAWHGRAVVLVFIRHFG